MSRIVSLSTVGPGFDVEHTLSVGVTSRSHYARSTPVRSYEASREGDLCCGLDLSYIPFPVTSDSSFVVVPLDPFMV